MQRFLATFFLLIGGCERATLQKPPVECFDTPMWNGPGSLLLRADSEGSDVLLLRHISSEDEVSYSYGNTPPTQAGTVIYLYRPGAKVLAAIEEKAWDSAKGVVSSLPHELRARGGPFEIKRGGGVLRYGGDGGRLVQTTKKYALYVGVSHDGDWAAVVSAEGPKPTRSFSLMPFIGAGLGPTKGPRYHQLFKSSDASPIGQAILLPFDERIDTCGPFWSPDGKYIVYPSEYFSRVCIIHVDWSGTEAK